MHNPRKFSLKKLFHLLTSRIFIVIVLIMVQLAIFVLSLTSLGRDFAFLKYVFKAVSFLCLLKIINSNDNPAYKIPWIILIIVMSPIGGLIYLLFGTKSMPSYLDGRTDAVFEKTKDKLNKSLPLFEKLEQDDKSISKQVAYIENRSFYPVYQNTQTRYYPLGEEMFEAMLNALRGAKHFIFMEYFIVDTGIMWDQIREILVEKAKEGVDVRLLYDDLGCIMTLPSNFAKNLRKDGVKVYAFNPVHAKLDVKMNSRDHRKILVVDGHIGFTGGVNIADEYINAYEKHGHWKDGGVMLQGEAVWNLTVMFLQFWHYADKSTEDFSKFAPDVYGPAYQSDGYVQPYADSPLDDEILGEQVYLNVISNAKDYVYINTPYLIIDNEMTTALTLAAKSGIDVRITTPHIPDKWYVHLVTRSYYHQLIKAGVKVYEYLPGFIHAKSFVSDDTVGVIGTTNLDFRSLYLHYECGVWMYKSSAVLQLKQDYLDTLEKCKQITLEECMAIPKTKRFIAATLRLLSPLM